MVSSVCFSAFVENQLTVVIRFNTRRSTLFHLSIHLCLLPTSCPFIIMALQRVFKSDITMFPILLTISWWHWLFDYCTLIKNLRLFILALWRMQNTDAKNLGSGKADKGRLCAVSSWCRHVLNCMWKHDVNMCSINMQKSARVNKNKLTLHSFLSKLHSFYGIHCNRPTIQLRTKRNLRKNTNLKIKESKKRQNTSIQKENIFTLKCSLEIFSQARVV